MPRAQKKRGRRAEKHQDTQGPDNKASKRRKIDDDFEVQGDLGDDFVSFTTNDRDPYEVDGAKKFYGLLTEEEQEYYASVNNNITSDDFESEEDRNAFILAVHRESTGKEIKVASSQSCSRYLEKVIQLSRPNELRHLFDAFLQDLDYLVQHRFGSHCCESLFRKCAQFVVLNPKSDDDMGFENNFLQTAKMFQANTFLVTEKFASHPFRMLLLVLAGEPLDDESIETAVASRKKEKIEPQSDYSKPSAERRKVPASFAKALVSLSSAVVSGFDTVYLRALSTQPLASPVIQLLVRLELTSGAFEGVNEEDRLLHKLLQETSLEADSDGGKFVSGLVYDPTGSHLIETLVQYLPGKLFKRLYKNLFKDRIGKLAKNEIAGFVAVRIINRIGKDELHEAMLAILEELPGLIERNRLAVVRTLIERCNIRGVDLNPLKDRLQELYGQADQTMVLTMLQIKTSESSKTTSNRTDAAERTGITADLQGSLLVQAMLQTNTLSGVINESITQVTDAELLNLAKHPVASRVLQVALKSPATDPKHLRQLVPRFYSIVYSLATDQAGSHVADALWDATANLHFMKERLAQNLQQNEKEIRDSVYGRNVWRNWSMDLYQRRRLDWQAIAKGRTEMEAQAKGLSASKSAIELARERHMQKLARAKPQMA